VKTQLFFNGVSDMVISVMATVVVAGLVWQGVQALWEEDMPALFETMRQERKITQEYSK